jgi:hypothetical protein
MPEPRSAVEVLSHVLSILSERVRRLEREAGEIAASLEQVREKVARRRQGEPVSGEGPEPVAAPGPS